MRIAFLGTGRLGTELALAVSAQGWFRSPAARAVW